MVTGQAQFLSLPLDILLLETQSMPLPPPPLPQLGQLKMSPDIAKYVLGSKRDLGSKLLA